MSLDTERLPTRFRDLTNLALTLDARRDPPGEAVVHEALRRLPDAPAAERRSLVRVLLGADLPAARVALGQSLARDHDPEVRALCLAAGTVDPDFPLEPLLVAARDFCPELRALALEALAGRSEPVARDGIIELLRDVHPTVATRARGVLGEGVEPDPVPAGLLDGVRAGGGWLPWAWDRTFGPLVNRSEDLLRALRLSANKIDARNWAPSRGALGSWSADGDQGDSISAKVYWGAGDLPAILRWPGGQPRKQVELRVSDPSLLDGLPAGTLHVSKPELARALRGTFVWIYVPGEGCKHQLQPFRVLGPDGQALDIPFGGSPSADPERCPVHAQDLQVAFIHPSWSGCVEPNGPPE
jgi:hypothetical protein